MICESYGARRPALGNIGELDVQSNGWVEQPVRESHKERLMEYLCGG
jgi:hypothetical protein